MAALAASLAVLLGVAPGQAPVAGLGHGWRSRRRRRQVHLDAAAEVPDLVDLLVLAVSAGATPLRAVALVAPRAPPAWRPALVRVLRRVEAGARFAEAADELVLALGEAARPVAAALVGSARYGTPLLPVLERLASESRAQRRRAVEAASKRLGVLLLFPLVLCTLPALGILTVVPALAGALRAIRP